MILALGISNPTMLSMLCPGKLASFAVQFLFSIVYGYIIFFPDALNRPFSKILLATGLFSYSLYVIHYPILFMFLSVTQNWMQSWMQSSYFRTALVSAIALLVIIPTAYLFSAVFERPRKFKPRILGAFNKMQNKLQWL